MQENDLLPNHNFYNGLSALDCVSSLNSDYERYGIFAVVCACVNTRPVRNWEITFGIAILRACGVEFRYTGMEVNVFLYK